MGAEQLPRQASLAVCCCARNEADVLDAFIAFYLAQGADLVLITDHGSDDGTGELLEFYARHAPVAYARTTVDEIQQGVWMTTMAGIAAERGASWVINADADEFWYPTVGSLRELFSALPANVNVLHAFHQDFLPPPEQSGFAPDSQTVWDTGLEHGFYAQTWKPKVAHRADGNVTVNDGNHSVSGLGRTRPLNWLPIDILHFPIRSYEHLEHKIVSHLVGWKRISPPRHIESLADLHRRGVLRTYYDELTDPAAVRTRVEEGRFGRDGRLALYLAELRKGSRAVSAAVSPGGYPVPDLRGSMHIAPVVTRAVRLAQLAQQLRDTTGTNWQGGLVRNVSKSVRRVVPRGRRRGAHCV